VRTALEAFLLYVVAAMRLFKGHGIDMGTVEEGKHAQVRMVVGDTGMRGKRKLMLFDSWKVADC